MPYANPQTAAVSNRERQRRFRDRRREEKRAAALTPPETPPDVLPVDAADLLAAWCGERLIVPPGHPLAGQPMVLPEYVRDFLSDVLCPTVKEGLLCTARKNSKTGGIAMFLLGLMAGPLRRPGLRVGTVYAALREQVLDVLVVHRHLIPTARRGHYMMVVPHD